MQNRLSFSLSRALALLLAAALLLGAAGCGRKGPLVLPDDMKKPPEKTAEPAK